MEANWEEYINRECNEKKEYKENLIPLNEMKIKDFAKRSMAIQIFSKTFDEEIWFCSNEEMANKIREDDPESICYTADELIHLNNLNLDKSGIRKLHNLKKTFRGKIALSQKHQLRDMKPKNQ